MRLLPANLRNKYRCAMCGKQPVKYAISCSLPTEDAPKRERAFCSLCALRFVNELREHDTCFQDEEK